MVGYWWGDCVMGYRGMNGCGYAEMSNRVGAVGCAGLVGRGRSDVAMWWVGCWWGDWFC